MLNNVPAPLKLSDEAQNMIPPRKAFLWERGLLLSRLRGSCLQHLPLSSVLALYDVGDIVHSVRAKWGIKANCPCSNRQFKLFSKPALKEDLKQVLLLMRGSLSLGFHLSLS